MSRTRGRAEANLTAVEQAPDPDVQDETQVEDQVQDENLVTQDPYDRLEGRTPEEAIASNLGAPNDYPYIDKTAVPLHERNQPVSTDAGGPSQAELNPAFYPKPEDGGPVTANNEGIGTEPNVHDQMLAAAQKAEDAGQEGAVEQAEQQIAEGQEQQMDAEAVTAAAQERAPEGVDAATGQPEGQVTPPGAPSGMEPPPEAEGTAGASGDPQASEQDNRNP